MNNFGIVCSYLICSLKNAFFLQENKYLNKNKFKTETSDILSSKSCSIGGKLGGEKAWLYAVNYFSVEFCNFSIQSIFSFRFGIYF